MMPRVPATAHTMQDCLTSGHRLHWLDGFLASTIIVLQILSIFRVDAPGEGQSSP
jgi:hypothetical protein